MLNVGRTVLVWIGRHLLALLLILLILIAARYAFEPARGWVDAQVEASRQVPAGADAHRAALDRLREHNRQRAAQIEAATAELARLPADGLRARRAAIGPEVRRLEELRLGTAALALAAARGDSEAIFDHYRAAVEIALLEREARYIDALLAATDARGRAGDLAALRAQAVAGLRSSHARWQAARAEVERLNRRPLAGARNLVCDRAYVGIGCENYRALESARAARDRALAENERAQRAIRRIDAARGAIGSTRAAAADAASILRQQEQAIETELAGLERRAAGNWVLWAKKPILETLPAALAILAAAILLPMLVKAFLFFLVAPLASRRPPIRLVPSDRGAASDGGMASAVSQRIPVDSASELLLLPEALQSTPHHAAKATQWLLSWSMPLSSLASNMVALVRIRSAAPDFVLASATHGPFAEIALLTIPEGSAMVVRPRALRGLSLPAGRTVRITRHWRLAHLSAWLTFQFRYLVFHGPVTLVVQGNRGVRLEPAGPGRGINQAATIGFSAGLLYSVRRSEAFGAYLLGRQELFNDSFDGAGFALYEEMPREGEARGIWGRGLRGLGDAFLKVFGI